MTSPSELTDSTFSLVIVSNPDLSTLSTICSSPLHIPVFAVFGDGAHAYILNLNRLASRLPHLLTMDRAQLQALNPESSLWMLLSHLPQHLTHSPVAVAAVIGGFVAKFVVDCLSDNDSVDNVFEFDSFSMNGTVYHFSLACWKQKTIRNRTPSRKGVPDWTELLSDVYLHVSAGHSPRSTYNTQDRLNGGIVS